MDHKSVAFKLKLGLGLAGFLLFAPSLAHPFHFDDALILNDSNVVTPANWAHFLNPLHLRELTYFTFYLNHLIAGSNAASYHFVNVILHVTNALLFFTLLDGLVERRMAFFAAAIFMVHPLQTEPVLYVYQRSILLACFFSLLACIALRRDRWGLASILFVCAFESKESAIAVPLLVVVIRWLSDRKSANERRFRVALLALVIGLGIGAIAILNYHHEATVGLGAMRTVSPVSYLLTETRVVYTYLRLLVFPYPQSIEYEFSWIRALDLGTALRILGILAAVGFGFALARLRDWRLTGFSIIAFFVLIAPTSTLLPSADAAFEHRLYLPMAAFAVFAVSLALKLKRSTALTVPIIAIFIIATLVRSNVWATDARLWEDTVRRVPNKARAWFNLGGAYLQTDPERAKTAYHRAIEILPDLAEAYYDLGVIDQSKGNYRAAVGYYEHAISIDANYWPAWNNLGNTLVSLGDMDRAMKAFETTLRLNPDHWPSQYNIAVVHFNSGRFDESIPRLRTVLDWRPDFRDARYLLVMALSRTGQRAEAEREWHNMEANAGQPPMPTTIPTPARNAP